MTAGGSNVYSLYNVYDDHGRNSDDEGGRCTI